MAELLTVVAILAILMGLVGIAVFNYVRDLTLTEYDNAAKSIYVAAQNSIADLQASGEWMANEDAYTTGAAQNPTAPRTDDDGQTRGDDDLYYYVSAQFARGNGILPAGSIEADVWDGDFIIEYRYDTATVYGVFYTEGGQDALNGFYGSGVDVRDRGTRRDNDFNIIVGYYGGAAAKNLDSVTLEEPVVSAGRSSVLAVTDPNLEKAALDSITLATIEKAAPEGGAAADPAQQLKLMLRKEHGVVSVRIIANGAATKPIDDSFVKMSGDLGEETTYSIDLVQLKANAQTAPHLSDLSAGDEFRVTARVTTSAALCRPAYGYGTGIWPGAGAETIFTSNIIADYETEADLYVYRDEVNKQGGGIVFNLENWYNDLTSANEDLYYRIVPDGRIKIDGVTREGKAAELVNNDYYKYPYDDKKHVPHQVTFSISSINDQKVMPDGAVMDIKVNAYRKGTLGDVPAAEVAKTLTIHVRVLNQRPFGYHVVDQGSYAEVVVTAGTEATGPVTIADNTAATVSDESSTAYAGRAYDGRAVELRSIPAGGSVSIKFFKTNTGITLNEGSFTVNGPGQ